MTAFLRATALVSVYRHLLCSSHGFSHQRLNSLKTGRNHCHSTYHARHDSKFDVMVTLVTFVISQQLLGILRTNFEHAKRLIFFTILFVTMAKRMQISRKEIVYYIIKAIDFSLSLNVKPELLLSLHQLIY